MAGEAIARAIGSWGQWIAAAILFVIGARLIWEQYKGADHQWRGDPTRGSSLIVLMFATSIDALAAGLSLALVGAEILYPAIIIGVVCAVLSGAGLWFGHAVGLKFSRGAAIFGGFILIALAAKTALG